MLSSTTAPTKTLKRIRSQSPTTTSSNSVENDSHDALLDVQTDDRQMKEKSACWKCQGHGRKFQKRSRKYDGSQCGVCNGTGQRQESTKSQTLSQQPGRIIPLRGMPSDSSNPGGFLGPPAVGNIDKVQLQRGEILASLGCGDWRIFQLANGHKLTVDDFLCARVACDEMRVRGYGPASNGPFGQEWKEADELAGRRKFHHADIGCGCGSVLMTMAWAFPGSIQSHGVEAQIVSHRLCQRGIEFNLGEQQESIKLVHADLRSWNPTVNSCSKNKEETSNGSAPQDPKLFDLVTGTPPYFPLDRFVASENHSQKIRCRVPTRGAASDYIAAAARLLGPNGIFVMVETARQEAKHAVMEAIEQHQLGIWKRIDVITRTGLPPRFSCWVLGKQTSCFGSNDSTRKPSSTTSYPIITFTLRDEQQIRTQEYVDAMEIMGWIDFEDSRQKWTQEENAETESSNE